MTIVRIGTLGWEKQRANSWLIPGGQPPLAERGHPARERGAGGPAKEREAARGHPPRASSALRALLTAPQTNAGAGSSTSLASGVPGAPTFMMGERPPRPDKPARASPPLRSLRLSWVLPGPRGRLAALTT